MKRLLIVVLLSSGVISAQIFTGNQSDVPVPLVSDKFTLYVSGFGGSKIQSGPYASETYKSILPPFGISLGIAYRNLYFHAGYIQNRNAEITFQHTIWNNEKFYALWGVNGLIVPDIESEGTDYIPAESTSKFLRIPLFAELYMKPLKYVEAGVGVGLGRFAQNKYLEQPLKVPGFFATVAIKPVEFIKIYWEGYTSTWKRNLGIVLGPFKGIELVTAFRYCAYPPEDKFAVQQGFVGVRAEIPGETIFKPAISEVKLIVKEQVTGKPVNGAQVISPEGKFPTLITNESGEITTALKPGIYPFKVTGNSKYAPLSSLLEIKPKQKSVTLEVKLRYSNEYLDYLAILERAREFLRKSDIKNAEIEINKALKLFPEDEEGLKVKDSLYAVKSNMIKEKTLRAENYLKSKRYRDAINELQGILSFDPQNQEVRKRIDSIRIVMLEERKKETPRPVQKVTPPPSAKPKPEPKKEKVSVPDLIDRGKKLFFEGKYRDAKTYFEKALKLDPNNKEAKFYLDKCDSYIKMMGG
ncbi:MAG: tetratricopeptide repeat protein [bacterium]|nr:tetratricopeptide repeat protein [bacterium]